MSRAYYCLFLLPLLLQCQCLRAQDYFEDVQGNGFPILAFPNNRTLLSTRINIGDNSAKVNFFQFYPVSAPPAAAPQQDTGRNLGVSQPVPPPRVGKYADVGWGLFAKGKIESGLGNLFTSGDLVPGVTGGAYLALRQVNVKATETIFGGLILSATYSGSNYRFFNPKAEFTKQFSDTTYRGFQVGLSKFSILPVGLAKDNLLIVGGSVSVFRQNNYNKMAKAEIKTTTTYANPGGDTTRIATQVDDEGYLFAIGEYKQYVATRLRVHAAYLPASLKGRIGVLTYPSVELSASSAPKYNLGFGLQYLVEGSPLVSTGGLFVEFNDIDNAGNSNKKFINRSVSIGFTAALNIPTRERRE
jgi:hypothetical protein